MLKTRLDLPLYKGSKASSIARQKRHDNGMNENWDDGFRSTAGIFTNSASSMSLDELTRNSENC